MQYWPSDKVFKSLVRCKCLYEKENMEICRGRYVVSNVIKDYISSQELKNERQKIIKKKMARKEKLNIKK